MFNGATIGYRESKIKIPPGTHVIYWGIYDFVVSRRTFELAFPTPVLDKLYIEGAEVYW